MEWDMVFELFLSLVDSFGINGVHFLLQDIVEKASGKCVH